MSIKQSITTLSQCGSRKSFVELHVRKLLKSFENYEGSVNHIFYIVGDNIKMIDYLEEISNKNKKINILYKNDNNYTNFKRLKNKAPYGGDCNYDFMIRNKKFIVGDIFLTLHDDSLLISNNIGDQINQAILNGNNYGGYLDTRKIRTYDKIILDGKKMTDLRIGTWFYFAKTKEYLKNDYTIGDYTNYWQLYLRYKYKFNKRLLFTHQKIWLNGGFDFNIRARLNNESIKIFNYNDMKNRMAEHFEKVTGFFAARNLLDYSDTDVEWNEWKKYLSTLTNNKQIEFDIMYFTSLHTKLNDNEIKDDFINIDTISKIKKYFEK